MTVNVFRNFSPPLTKSWLRRWGHQANIEVSLQNLQRINKVDLR